MSDVTNVTTLRSTGGDQRSVASVSVEERTQVIASRGDVVVSVEITEDCDWRVQVWYADELTLEGQSVEFMEDGA